MEVVKETPDPKLTLGRTVRLPGVGVEAGGFPSLLCHDPVLQPHLEKPWLRAWIGRELGLAPTRTSRPARTAAVTEAELARHCLVVGTSGSGKSRLAELMVGQLLARGHSLLAVEPKLDTIRQIAAQAQAAGLSPGQVTVISPRAPGGVPGWNPLLAPLPAAENAEDLVALIAGNATSWGPRLADLLANVAHVVAAHRLSVFELMRGLRDPDYLGGLLEQPPPGRLSAAYLEAADALKHEFLTGSKSARAESFGAVTNKIRKTLRSDFLKALLSARTNTLNFSQLWKRQSVVLVHLDRATLGEEGAGFLAGIVASSLFRTSLRVTGPVPVTLTLDEIATAEHFVGETLTNIATFSRSANLRLLAAAQNLGQMSGPLREAMLSAGVQISFRLSPGDARLVAASLSAGTEPTVARVRAEGPLPGKPGSQAQRSTCVHALRDGSGRPLRLNPVAWQRLRTEELFRLPGEQAGADDPLDAASRLAARHGVPRLYVRAADTGKPVEVRRYVSGLAPASYWVDGPRPLALVVSFPTPRLTGAERRGESDAVRGWIRTLQGLPVQHAILRIGGGEPAVFRVDDVPETSQAQVGPYLAAALQANGQAAAEVEACAKERGEAVRRLAGREGSPVQGSPVPGRGAVGSSGTAARSAKAAEPDHEERGDGISEEQRKHDEGAGRNGHEEKGAGTDRFPSPFDAGEFADDGSLG